MVLLGVAAVTVLIPVLFFLVFLVGIPITGITFFIIQNGKLLAILLALIIGYKLFTK